MSTETLSTYEVELQSTTDQQHRVVSGEFESREAAVAHAEQAERDIVAFSLLPPDRDTWEQGTYIVHTEDGDKRHAKVNLSNWDAYHPSFAKHAAGLSYKGAVSAATRRLEDLSRRVEVDARGKVRYSNLNARALTRLTAHQQIEPYAVADVRKVDAAEREAIALVQRAKAMQGDPRKWSLTLRKLREAGIPLNVVTAALAGLTMQAQISGSNPWVWSSATIQTSLHSAFSFDPDATDFQNDISASEHAATGNYSTGGVTLGTKTSNYTSGTDLVWLGAANASWATSTISATDANIWVNTAGAASTDMVIGNVDFAATVTTTAGTFLITWDATGGIVAIDVT